MFLLNIVPTYSFSATKMLAEHFHDSIPFQFSEKALTDLHRSFPWRVQRIKQHLEKENIKKKHPSFPTMLLYSPFASFLKPWLTDIWLGLSGLLSKPTAHKIGGKLNTLNFWVNAMGNYCYILEAYYYATAKPKMYCLHLLRIRSPGYSFMSLQLPRVRQNNLKVKECRACLASLSYRGNLHYDGYRCPRPRKLT